MKTYCLLLGAWLYVISLHAQWQPLGAPEGGVVSTLASADNTLWAGTPGGVFRSTDGAASWQPVPLPLTGDYWVRKIAARAGLVVAAWAKPSLPVPGLAVSSDLGASWQLVDLPPVPGVQVYDLALTGTTIYLALGLQLFESTDGGQTWQLNDLSDQTGQITRLQWSDGTLYATSGNTIWRLPDGSAVWEQVGLPAANPAYFFAVDNDLWLVSMQNGGATWRSTDQGQNWEPTFWSGAGFVNPLTQIVAYDGTLVGLRDSRLVQSTDGGLLWSVANADPLPAGLYGPIDELAVDGTTLLARHFTGLLRTDDPHATFSAANTGFSSRGTRALEVADDGFVYAVFDAFYRKPPVGGDPWEFRKAKDPTVFYHELRRHGNYLFATATHLTDFARVERSDDGWLTSATVFNEVGQAPGPMAATPDALFTLTTVNRGFYARRTTDFGDSWENISVPLQQQAGQYAKAMGWQNGLLLAAIPGQFNSFYRSDDNGDTWSEQPATGLLPAPNVSTVSSLFGAGGQFFAVLGTALFRSTDNGLTWLPADDGLPTDAVQFNDLLAIDENVLLLAVDDKGVYRSADGGVHWDAFHDGLGTHQVNTLRADATHVYAATQYHGVWKRGFDEVVSATEPVRSPTVASVRPNPVSGHFTITAGTEPDGQTGRLELFDSPGGHRLVMAIQIGRPMELDSRLEAGTYFFRLTTATHAFSGRLVVAGR